jgi:sarcosine oxidase
MDTADVVVVGLGAVGSATLHRLAKQGVRAIGIDRFHPPHDRGSTHGESRITRLGVGEGAAYASLVRRSHAIWRELEAETGETLLLQTGGLILGPPGGGTSHHGQGDFVGQSIAVAQAGGVPHEVLDAAEIARRYPQLALQGDEIGYFEPSAGVVLPERCVAVQLRLAAALGAAVRTGETVLRLDETPGGVTVVTDRGQLQAGAVVLCAGPWLPGLAGPAVAAQALVYRQTLHWYPVADPAAFAPERFPVFIWIHGATPEDYFYGFPILPGSAAIKVASERYAAPVDPDQMERVVPAAESAAIHQRHIAGRLPGVGAAALRAATCFYTVTPDSGFLVDLAPGSSRVVLASACSGHGFKHSAGLGEALAAMATGDRIVIPPGFAPFALGRFGP